MMPLLNGQVPIVYSAPNVAEHVPAGSYINVADFATVDDLVAHLRFLEANPAAYAQYHAWRDASFSTYGVFFRRELLRWITMAFVVGGAKSRDIDGMQELESHCSRCAMCYSMSDWGHVTGWVPPYDDKPAPPRHIQRFRDTCTPPWSPVPPPPRLPAFPNQATVTAAQFYGAEHVPASAVEAEIGVSSDPWPKPGMSR